MISFASTAAALAGGSLFLVTVLAACSSTSSGGSSQSFAANSTEYTGPDGSTGPLESPGTCSGTTGGAVAGPDDNHCVHARRRSHHPADDRGRLHRHDGPGRGRRRRGR